MRDYYVYILSSYTGVLYVGMTNDLERRVHEHKNKLVPGFTSQYDVNRLVYYEVYGKPSEAIAREKQIKGWGRRKKILLIVSKNPKREDLAAEWDREGIELRSPLEKDSSRVHSE